MQTLYLSLKDQVTLIGLQKIRICDIAELDGEPSTVKRVRNLVLMDIRQRHPHSLRLDVLDITRILRSHISDVVIQNVGASESLIHFRPDRPQRNPLLEFGKVTFIGFILFFGAVISLMSFQNEASLPEIFINIHRICTGEVTERPTALLISYTIGIAVGISVFFNHWAGIKIKEDPTPVEVEYVSYEKEIQTCMLELLKNQDDFGQEPDKGAPS